MARRAFFAAFRTLPAAASAQEAKPRRHEKGPPPEVPGRAACAGLEPFNFETALLTRKRQPSQSSVDSALEVQALHRFGDEGFIAGGGLLEFFRGSVVGGDADLLERPRRAC